MFMEPIEFPHTYVNPKGQVIMTMVDGDGICTESWQLTPGEFAALKTTGRVTQYNTINWLFEDDNVGSATSVLSVIEHKGQYRVTYRVFPNLSYPNMKEPQAAIRWNGTAAMHWGEKE